MAAFEPRTTINLYRGTGVDAQNQPYFTSQGAKMGWYSGFLAYTKTIQSYQRTERQYCRIDGTQELYRDCDVLAFQNESGKWIICNILYTEFINPNCTEIGFKVDYFQTFMEDIVWCDCMVEREMQENDWAGGRPSFNNLVPEGIETGPLIAYTDYSTYTFTNFKIVVLSAYDRYGEISNNPQTDSGGYVTGLNHIVLDSAVSLGSMLETYSNKGRLDGIAAIYMCPAEYATPPGSEPWVYGPVDIAVNFSNYLGYQIQNAKLFTGEFFRVELTNRMGSRVYLHLEDFHQPSLGVYQVQLEGAFMCGAGGALCYPKNYMGMTNAKDYGVILYNDVQCAYIGNAYANWAAQNRNSNALAVTQDILGGISGFASNLARGVSSAAIPGASGMLGAVSGGVRAVESLTTMGNTAAKIMDAQVNPSMVGGQINGATLSLATKTYGFLVQQQLPHLDMVMRIDSYFSRYGYRTMQCKKPNVNTRPFWNFVKTDGGIVKGPIPYMAKVAIQQTMDAGVTFWNVLGGATIGDFSKDNRG